MANINPGLSDVRDRRKQIAGELEKLRSEDFDLETAERVLSRMVSLPTLNNVIPVPLKQQVARLTSSDLIEIVLKESPSAWMTTEAVQASASEKAERDIPMGTIAPTLSNMKRDGIIIRDGNKVAHASRSAEVISAESTELPPRRRAPSPPSSETLLDPSDQKVGPQSDHASGPQTPPLIRRM